MIDWKLWMLVDWLGLGFYINFVFIFVIIEVMLFEMKDMCF